MSDSTVPLLHIAGLRKEFAGNVALKDISVDVGRGQVLALLGPSGCGKTTLLRCIAGLAEPDAGRIKIAGETVYAPGKHAPPEARNLGMVFQDYALWPHMTVAENVAFPLEMTGVSKKARRVKVQEALSLVGLQAMADRSPGTLSGGQQQRVALARAIVGEPRLLLMDEPLSNLDKNLREHLALDIRQLIERLNLTAVFVTHDQQEAYALADAVAVLQEGHLTQIDRPEAIYNRPATADIARFLDAGTLVEGWLQDDGLKLGRHLIREEPAIDYRGPLTVLVPRQAISFCAMEQSDAIARVEGRLFQGEDYSLRLRLCPEVSLRMLSRESIAAGDTAGLQFDRTRLLAWDNQGRRHMPLCQNAQSTEGLCAQIRVRA